MRFYPCVLCPNVGIVNIDKRFLFFHLKNKHLLVDIQNKVDELGIVTKSYRESKYSLINSLIDYSTLRGYKY